jgi:hypothetical protein
MSTVAKPSVVDFEEIVLKTLVKLIAYCNREDFNDVSRSIGIVRDQISFMKEAQETFNEMTQEAKVKVSEKKAHGAAISTPSIAPAAAVAAVEVASAAAVAAVEVEVASASVEVAAVEVAAVEVSVVETSNASYASVASRPASPIPAQIAVAQPSQPSSPSREEMVEHFHTKIGAMETRMCFHTLNGFKCEYTKCVLGHENITSETRGHYACPSYLLGEECQSTNCHKYFPPSYVMVDHPLRRVCANFLKGDCDKGGRCFKWHPGPTDKVDNSLRLTCQAFTDGHCRAGNRCNQYHFKKCKFFADGICTHSGDHGVYTHA